MSDVRCYLNACPDGHDHPVTVYDETLGEQVPTGETVPCVIYSCEIDGVLSWASHIPNGPSLLTRLNGSYDTYDHRDGTMLAATDYTAALVEAAGVDLVAGTADDVTARTWWKPSTWRQ